MDRKKILKYGLLLGLTGLIFVLGMSIGRKASAKIQGEKEREVLPAFELTNVMTGAPFNLNRLTAEAAPTAIVYFNPECSHCENEAEALAGKWQEKRAKGLRWLWISSAAPESIEAFAEQHGLAGAPGMYFLHDHDDGFFSHFGTSLVPSHFLYDESGRLIKHIKGETTFENVLKYVDQENASAAKDQAAQ